MSKYIYRVIHTFLLLSALGSLLLGFASLVMCVAHPNQVTGPHLGAIGLTVIGWARPLSRMLSANSCSGLGAKVRRSLSPARIWLVFKR